MSDPQTKAELLAALKQVQNALTQTVQTMPNEQFNSGTAQSWSASGYLQHLILSVKPFGKAMKLPAEQLRKTFGKPEQPSRSYAELVAAYKARLEEGVRAEDYESVTPITYRFPEGVDDQQQYLVDTWNDTNNRLLAALESWTEEDLDAYQLPHPAVGMLTIREMLFFTVYHNTLHWHDIEQASEKAKMG